MRSQAAARSRAPTRGSEPPRWLARELRRHYRLAERRQGPERVLPLSGYMSEAGMVTPYDRDQRLYLPSARAER